MLLCLQQLLIAEISEQDENHRSPLDDMMDELRAENPHSMAVSFYADFKKKYITQRDINNRIRSAQWTVDNSDDPQQIESAKKILAKYSANSPKPVKEPTPAARPVQVEAPVEKHDFTITDEHLGEGGQKAKFSANIAVIRTLKAIEGENRLADFVGTLSEPLNIPKDEWQYMKDKNGMMLYNKT